MPPGLFYRVPLPSRVPRLPFVPSVLLVLGVATLAGCLGPVQEPGQGPPDPAQQVSAGGPLRGPLEWRVGDTWRYAVSGAWVAEPGFVVVGVVESDGTQHHVAGDDPQEWARAVAARGGLLVGRVDAKGLTPHVDGAPRDLLGFDRAPGETWEVVLWGTSFALQRTGTVQVDGALGHRVAGGSSQGWTLFAEYNEQVGWFSRFDLRDAEDRLLVGYRFMQSDAPVTLSLQSWRVLESHRAIGFPDRVGYVKWHSGGDADRLVVSVGVHDDEAVHRAPESQSDTGLLQRVRGLLDGVLGAGALYSSSSGSALATVLSPGEDRVFEWRTNTPGMRVELTRDEPGDWHAVASTGGPVVELGVHRVQVIHHAL